MNSIITNQLQSLHPLQVLLQTVPQCTSTIPIGNACLPITPFTWITVASIALLIVIFVAAIVYMLGNVIGSDRAKNWSRFQIYEALLTGLLIAVFGALVYLLFLNPQTTFSQLNLVPQTQGSVTGCESATELYTLATCDLVQFTDASLALGQDALYATYIVDAIPGFSGAIDPIPTGIGISMQITLPSLVPTGSGQIFTLVISAMMFLLIFNQIQVIALAGAIFFLSFFLTIGLIARTVGFARTFGGAMIAFGIGLGVIYPLLVVITYGYIDVSICATCLQSASNGTLFLNGFVSLMTSLWTGGFTGVGTTMGTIFLDTGYVIAGLTFIPLLNFAIVDAFIIDFSSAIGEKMSFGQLFSGFI
jgi:hypothetical protein